MFTKIGIYNRIGMRNMFSRSAVRFNSTKSTPHAFNWVEYLKLKRQNSVLNTAGSVLTGLAGGFITLNYLGNIEIELEKHIFGMDAIMVMGGAVLLGAGFGYLLGPFLGTYIFSFKNKAVLNQFKIKDREFLQRIKINRVDPSSQSFSNPVPDYYGEKIYSLKGYKQWLRDCNAYRRKSKDFL
jgi:import inner membrane translocase subunit TIM23